MRHPGISRAVHIQTVKFAAENLAEKKLSALGPQALGRCAVAGSGWTGCSSEKAQAEGFCPCHALPMDRDGGQGISDSYGRPGWTRQPLQPHS